MVLERVFGASTRAALGRRSIIALTACEQMCKKSLPLWTVCRYQRMGQCGVTSQKHYEQKYHHRWWLSCFIQTV